MRERSSDWSCGTTEFSVDLALAVIACKILGAASEEGLGFDLVLRLGRAMSGAMASVCAALDHCHIPGRGHDDGQHIDVGQVEIGLGLHNEKVNLHTSYLLHRSGR